MEYKTLEIDLSKMVPGQFAKTRSAGLVCFVTVNPLCALEDTSYLFTVFNYEISNLSTYKFYDRDGKAHGTTEFDIVEILPPAETPYGHVN